MSLGKEVVCRVEDDKLRIYEIEEARRAGDKVGDMRSQPLFFAVLSRICPGCC